METHYRSLMKAVSYRLISSMITGGIVFGATQQGLLALSVAGGETIIKVIVFFLHERAWSAIPLGKIEKSTELEELISVGE